MESVLSTLEGIKARFTGEGVTSENITILLLTLMTEANKMKRLTGSEKKTLVTSLLTHITLELCKEEDKEKLREMIQFTIPTLIDNFIEIGKGITFKNIKNKFFCC